MCVVLDAFHCFSISPLGSYNFYNWEHIPLFLNLRDDVMNLSTLSMPGIFYRLKPNGTWTEEAMSKDYRELDFEAKFSSTIE